MIIFRRGRQKAAALLLKIRPLRHNWRFLFGIAGLTACGSSISVSNNQALTIYPVKASVSAVLSPKIDETHDNSILQVLGSFFDWLSSGLQTLLRCGALWVHFLPPVVASPLLAIQMDEINDWWWNLFRSSICNAGPTFIKFAQVKRR